jgi:ankyrin repeat protein
MKIQKKLIIFTLLGITITAGNTAAEHSFRGAFEGDSDPDVILSESDLDLLPPNPDLDPLFVEAPELLDAIQANDKTAVKRAIKLGEDVNEAGSLGVTPLLLAIQYRKKEVIPVLLAAGANPNTPTRQGDSPLEVAIKEYDDFPIAQLLIQYGANINKQDEETGDTLLMWAIINNKPAIVDFLLKNKADIKIENNDGETAGDIATQYANATIIALLKKPISERQKEVAEVLIEEKVTLPTELAKEISEFEM